MKEIGGVYATLSATIDGITWSAHVQDFLPRCYITYVWVLSRDGEPWYQSHKRGFFTDRFGAHFRLRPNQPETTFPVGPRDWEIEVWVEDEFGTARSAPGFATYTVGVD